MNERHYLMMAIVPPALVVLLLTTGAAKSQLAAKQARSEATRLADQYPVSDQIADNRAAQSPDEIERRGQVKDRIRALQYLHDRGAAFSNEMASESDAIIAPGELWEEADIIKDVAAKSEPLVADFDSLISHEHYYWLDKTFLVQLRAAVHDNDQSAALRALIRMHQSGSRLRHGDKTLAHRIQRTLEFDFWHEPQEFQALRDLMSDDQQLEAAAKSQVRHSMINLRDELQNGGTYWRSASRHHAGVPGETERYWVDQIRSAVTASADLTSIPTQRDLARSYGKTMRLAGMSIVGIPLADCRAYGNRSVWSRHFASIRFHRRMTFTATAVKEYRITQGRWPERLSDLTDLGLASETWHYEPGQAFLYEVHPDLDEATVWVDREFRYLVDPIHTSSTVRYVPVKVKIR